MLIDLLSTRNYGMYNISVANLLGLQSAVYLNALVDINQKAISKNKLDEDFFKLDREYITKITTFDKVTQKGLEDRLCSLDILVKSTSDKDYLKINVNALTSLLMAENDSLKVNIKKLDAASKKTKSEKIIENLQSNITTDNEELRQAYFDWIAAVSQKFGWMSKTAVVSGQKLIDDYCNRDLDLALQIIEIASTNGYKDMTWAINMYESNYKQRFNRVTTISPSVVKKIQVSEEVF
jgi:hypothetical protein